MGCNFNHSLEEHLRLLIENVWRFLISDLNFFRYIENLNYQIYEICWVVNWAGNMFIF